MLIKWYFHILDKDTQKAIPKMCTYSQCFYVSLSWYAKFGIIWHKCILGIQTGHNIDQDLNIFQENIIEFWKQICTIIYHNKIWKFQFLL